MENHMKKTTKERNNGNFFKGAGFAHGLCVGFCLAIVCSLIVASAMNILKNNDTVNSTDGDSAEATEFIPEHSLSGDFVSEPDETATDTDSNGGMLVKQKKYEYNGCHVMILDITNQTDKNYTITIDAQYKNVNGKVIRREKRVFEGFPAGRQSYIVLQPGIKFGGFSYTLSADVYTDTCYAALVDGGRNIEFRTHWGHVDERGRYIVPIGPDQVKYFKKEVMVNVAVDDITILPCVEPISITGDIVVFDKDGKIISIGDARLNVGKAETKAERWDSYKISLFPSITTGIPVEQELEELAKGFSYPLPEEFKSASGFFAIKEVYPTYEKESAFPIKGKYYRDP